MSQRKFTQTNGMLFVLIPALSIFLLKFVQNYFSAGIAMLICTGLMLLVFIPAVKLFQTVVTFQDSFLQLKRGLFRKDVKINYTDINKITFSYDRFLSLWIYADGYKLKITPPSNKLN